MKTKVFILLLFTLLTLTSTLPLNQSIVNNINTNSLTSSNNKSKNSNNNNMRVNTITNPQPAYGYGAPISVSGVVNQTYYIGSVQNGSLSEFVNSAWFVPDQAISVYMAYNPCYSRDPTTLACKPQTVPSTHTISDYKLTVTSGKPHTGGTDSSTNPSGLGIDDTYGIWTNGTSQESYSVYKNYLEYNFTVQLPSQTGFQNLGITGSTTTIYEYYGGNSTIGDQGWVINATTISISSDNSIHVTPGQANYNLTAQSNTSVISFQVYSQSPSNPLYSSQINYTIERLSDGVTCSTSASCSSNLGLSVNEFGNSSYPDLTDGSGTIYFTTTFNSLGSALEGAYNFSVLAVLVNPPSPAIDWNTTTYFLTKNHGNWTYLTVNYNLQTPQVSQSNVSGYNLFPLPNADHTIRPGNYFEGNISQTVYSGTMGVVGAPVYAHLYSASANIDYTSQLYGGGFAQLSFLTTGGVNKSNTNGLLPFKIQLSYSIPLATYNLVFFADYSNMMNVTPYWINTTSVQLLQNYTFTVSDLFDSGSIAYYTSFPATTVKLTTNDTYLTVEFKAQATLNTQYQTYAQYYSPSVLPTNPYPLYNLQVIASIVGNPVNVSLVSTSGTTDANGLVNFTLYTNYPSIYNLSTFQLSVSANYVPMINGNLTFYRYTRDTSGGNTSTTNSAYVTFNPYYTIVNVIPYSNNVTSGSLRPGEVGLYIFRAVNESNTLQSFANVPFNFSIIEGMFTPGIGLYTNNTGNLSDAYGFIYIFFYSTYNVTPESSIPIPIRFNVILDITAYNKSIIGPNFFIGTQPMNKVFYKDYTDTWSYNNASTFNISSDYLYAQALFTAIPDKQILDPSTNLVRPNNETITIQVKIVYISNGAVIPGIKFPVKVSFVSSYTGLILTIKNAAEFPAYANGYYYTNSSGYIDYNLTLNYQSGYPLSQTIQLSATADFGNDTCATSSCNNDLLTWIVGENVVPGYMLSQESYSTTNSTNYLTIQEAPAYVTGSITALTAYTSKSSANPLNVVPNTVVNVPFKVTVQSSSYAIDDGISGAPLQGINVYINETLLNSYNFTLLNSYVQKTDINGIVVFQINITLATAKGIYGIPVYADFLNDQNVSTTVANKTGTFNSFWLNGAIAGTGNINSSITITNYSFSNSTAIHLFYANLMSVIVSKIFDKNNNLVPLDTTQILRGYTLQLIITYTDQNGTALPGHNVKLTTQVINQNGQLTNITISNIGVTDSSGQVVYSLITNNNFYVGKAGIVAEDENLAPNQPFYSNPANITIMAKLSFYQNPIIIMPKYSNEGFVGEQINVSGAISDDLGLINLNSYSSTVRNQLTNILISGYDNGNITNIGTNVTGILTFTSSFVYFSYNWTIPVNYNYNNINLRIEIPDSLNSIYFVKSNSSLYATLGGLPVYYKNILVYQNAKFEYSMTNTNALNYNSPNGNFAITNDYTGPINLNGFLYDNYGRLLANRTIQLFNSTSTFNVKSSNTGSFSYLSFVSQLNQNSTYNMHLTYLAPTNGSQINIFYITLTRTVYDIYAPDVFLANNLNTSYVYQVTTLNLTITDPTIYLGNYVAATGVNSTTVLIYENGTLYWNNTGGTNWNGVNPLQIPFNMPAYIASHPTATAVNLTLVVQDNAKNTAIVLILLQIDKIAPTISNTNPSASNTYLYQSNYHFSFQASDQQSGLNNASAQMVFVTNYGTIIAGTAIPMTYNATTNSFESGSFNLYGLKSGFVIYFTISDKAGNKQNTANFIVLADTVKPTIVLLGTTNNFDVTSQIVTFSFNVTDSGSGVNPDGFALYDRNNNLVLGNNSFSITNSGSTYTVQGQLAKNQLDLKNSQQLFNFNATDFNGNENNFTLLFKIDVIGPQITANSVYQPTTSNLINTKNNLNATMQYVRFSFADGGSPSTGVNTSFIQIELNINSTNIVYLTISNNVLTVSNSSFKNDFTFTLSNGAVTIGWNATDLAKYGFTQTRNVQYISVTWSVTQLNDNYGNQLISNNYNSLTYKVKIDALPPQPSQLGQLATLGAIFIIFIVIGVAAAYAYEKIRYVG